jgi:uncharacterized repeat protein (TIGR03806 family)
VAAMGLSVGCGGDDVAPVPDPPPAGSIPYDALSEYGFFTGEMVQHLPAAGVVPYEVAATLWADNADKKRFLVLPPGTVATPTEREAWELPLGTIVIKAFGFPEDLRDPASAVRAIETRLLILEDDGWSSHTYLWNDEQTEATLFVAGKEVTVSYLDATGETVDQPYQVPNTNQCKGCHDNDDVTHLLGVTTPQLNRQVTRDGVAVQQLEWLKASGVLGAASPDPATSLRFSDPFGSDPIDQRARSYLHANCSHCHRPGGGGGDSGLVLLAWEMDPSKNGVCKTPAAAGAGTGDRSHDIVPGYPDQSIMPFRMASTDPEIKMPELPNRLPDARGLALITDWIAGMEPKGCP